MRRLTLPLFLLTLLAASPAVARIAVHGLVTDAAGEAVAGATVRLLPRLDDFDYGTLALGGETGPPPVATARSGADGRFTVRAPEAGMYRLEIGAEGLRSLRHVLEPLVEEIILPAAVLRPAGVVRVTVKNAAGQPLAGAQVFAATAYQSYGSRSPWRPQPQLATCDDQGMATLARAAEEPLFVRAVAAGYLPTEAEEAKGDTLQLVAAAGIATPVTVRAHNGRPLAGVIVHVSDWDLPVGTTDEAGQITVTLPTAGPLALELVAADGRSLNEEVERPAPSDGADTAPLRLTLPPPASLLGTVIETASREPVAGAIVWPAGRPGAWTRSDGQGRYTIPPPSERRAFVLVAAAGYFQTWDEADLENATVPTLLLDAATGLAGTVVREDGAPVVGAALVATLLPTPDGRDAGARHSGGYVEEAESIADGRFRLPHLWPEARYTLAVKAAGFAPYEEELSTAAAGHTERPLVVTLSRGRLGFGTVRDTAEQPIAGAVVALRPTTPGRGYNAFSDAMEVPATTEAISDEEGSFALPHLPAGRFDLDVRAAGFAPLVIPGIEVPAPEVASGDSDIDLGTVYLEEGVAIVGEVVDGDGKALAGVSLHISRDSPTAAMRLSHHPLSAPGPGSSVTTEDGRFRIVDLRRDERYVLQATRPGYGLTVVPGVIAPNAEPLRISLARSGSLAGQVVDADGKAVAAAVVFMTYEQRLNTPGQTLSSSFGNGHGRTDEEGRFQIEDVMAGPLVVRVNAEGFQGGEKRLELAPGEGRKNVRIVIERGATVVGRVLTAAGQPIANATVMTDGKGESSDNAGRYRLSGMTLGTVDFRVYHPDHIPLEHTATIKAGENQLDLVLSQGVALTGRVTDGGGLPLAGVEIHLTTVGSGRPWGPLRAGTAADGRFRFPSVAPGLYLVTASKQGWASWSRSEPLEVEDSPLPDLEIQLEPGGAIAGRIVGLPLEFLAELSLSAIQQSGLHAGGDVGFDGTFRIPNLAPGEWLVSATVGDSSRRATETVILDPGATEASVELVFGDGLTLSGRVLGPSGPLSGAMVTVAETTARLSNGFTNTDYQGRFRIAGLEPGRYVLVVNLVNASISQRQEIELSDDREVTIELRAAAVSGHVFDGATGLPLAGARVAAMPVGDSTMAFPIASKQASDAQGFFSFGELTVGRYRITASREGYEPAEVLIDLQPEQAVEDLQILLGAARE